MKLKAIAAMAQNRAIGKGNQLPWDIPGDLKWFRKLTKESVVVMGRKTWESIGRALPKRHNVVITRNRELEVPEGVNVIGCLEALESLALRYPDVWIIGGSAIYELALPYCSEFVLNHIKREVEQADAFLPKFEDAFEAAEVLDDTDEFRLVRYIRRER